MTFKEFAEKLKTKYEELPWIDKTVLVAILGYMALQWIVLFLLID